MGKEGETKTKITVVNDGQAKGKVSKEQTTKEKAIKETSTKKETTDKAKAPKGKTSQVSGVSAKAVLAKKRKSIHPSFYETTASCVCGDKFVTYSTKKEVKVDICSKCHPYFTGKQKIIDAEGRVEKYHARLKGQKPKKEKKSSKKEVIEV